MSAGSSSFSRAAQRLGRQARADVEVRDLAERVDAGVGAARSVQLEVLPAGDGAHGAVDLALHGPRVLLNLPAAVARAGVFDRQLEARHCSDPRSAGVRARAPHRSPFTRTHVSHHDVTARAACASPRG